MKMHRKFLIDSLSPALVARIVDVVKTSSGTYQLVTRGRRFKAVKEGV